MPQQPSLTLAQINPILGDLAANTETVRQVFSAAKSAGSAALILPELALTGHPPLGLVRNPAFLATAEATLAQLAKDCADGPAIGIGSLLQDEGRVYSAWFVLEGGKIRQSVVLQSLDGGPVPQNADTPIRLAGLDLAVIPADAPATVPDADLILVPDAPAYWHGRFDQRRQGLRQLARDTGRPVIQCALTGGQDEVVHAGASLGVNPDGTVAVQLAALSEDRAEIRLEASTDGWRIQPGTLRPLPDRDEADYHAICIGLGDYLRKSGFSRVVLGLSGGIDSALVAAIAADVVGPENLRAVLMPSAYTTPESLEDAEAVAKALGSRLSTVSIEGARHVVEDALAPLMAGTEPDETEENIQARLRGVMLMALSNKFNEMLLTTGNKSELAVGYCTIYGDMCGGYNPLKDLYKTRVFQLCRWRNAHWRDWMAGPKGQVIAERIITKPPSAELRPDQSDADSLPPYEVLDPILEALVENDQGIQELADEGHDPELLNRIAWLITTSEWKRAQAAPGPGLTRRPFGRARLQPLANRWRERI